MATRTLLSVSLVLLVGAGLAAQDVGLDVSPSSRLAAGDAVTITVKAGPRQLYGLLVATSPFQGLDDFQGALAILSVLPEQGCVSQDFVVPESLAGLSLYLRAASVGDDGDVAFSNQVQVKIL